MKSTDSPKAYIVMPVFNEGRVITDVIKEIQQKTRMPIIAVEDGCSDDSYAKLLKIPDIIVLQHIINRGKGAAIKTGLEAAKLLGADYVVTMDSDGQHDPVDAAVMIKLLQQGYDVVLGSRLIDSKGMPLRRVILNKISNFFTWLAYGQWVTDSLSGFRAYSKDALAAITTRSDRYQFDSEVIREIKRNKLKYIEIPIKVRYTRHSTTKKDRVNLKTAIQITTNLFRPD